ncbi:MAG: phosphocholine cytidylyltransferase family protein [Deltaproteobacteria bacterium]|nr:phosphocholine cytidylyltransferase family protein [Deltaproteobacteria bacterium]
MIHETGKGGGLRAVVLVAGVARRLYPLTESTPKCLFDVGGKAIFDFQMEALAANGVRDVVLVVGYRREQILEHAAHRHPGMRFTPVVNHRFFETNTSYSLWLAGEEFEGRDFVYLNGDVLFEPRLLERVVKGPAPASLAVEKKPCGDEEVKVITDGGDRIVRIGKDLPHKESLGEFVGVARFDAPITGAFRKALGELVAGGRQNDYFEAALARMAPTETLRFVDVSDLPVIEIDFPSDLDNARKKVLARFGKG